MIRSIEIHNLRGIEAGKLDDFTPLVVLVGPNGCGKSTVLEAIYSAASPRPAEALQQIVNRRNRLQIGQGRWLVRRSGESATWTVTPLAGYPRTVSLSRPPLEHEALAVHVLDALPSRTVDVCTGKLRRNGQLEADGGTSPVRPVKGIGDVIFIDPQQHLPLHDMYSRAEEKGSAASLRAFVEAIVPEVRDIRTLTDNGTPVLHVVLNGYTVPVALEGEGIRTVLQVALELDAIGEGTALIEEPEVHEHPAAMAQISKLVWRAVNRSTQVILTTHSLELIDYLLADVESGEQLAKLSVYGLRLADGCLKSYREVGEDVAFARTRIGDDLR